MLVMMTDCQDYIEDPCICYDFGEPKGQCRNCGYAWYEHDVSVLPEEYQEQARQIQIDACLPC